MRPRAQVYSCAMPELLDESSYDEAVANGAHIVNVDTPTHVARLHPNPAACTSLRNGFVTKVVKNDGKHGSYWAVEDEIAARQRWGDEIAVCKRCG
jgi:hypothetical protein